MILVLPLAGAKVDNLLVGHELALGVDEPLRPEQGRVLEELGVVEHRCGEVIYLNDQFTKYLGVRLLH